MTIKQIQMMAASGRLVFVVWEDSYHSTGWTDKDPDMIGELCRSVGWVVGVSERVLMIAANTTIKEPKLRCVDFAIPLSAIRKFNVLPQQNYANISTS